MKIDEFHELTARLGQTMSFLEDLETILIDRFGDRCQSAVSNGNENEGEPDPLSSDELKLLLDKVQEHFTEHYSCFIALERSGCSSE